MSEEDDVYIAFSGGRSNHPVRTDVEKALNQMCALLGPIFGEVLINVGDCPTGVDKVVYNFLNDQYEVQTFGAGWKAHGKAAGPIRNKEMIHSSGALIAFWDGISKGTKNCIKCATDKGIPVLIMPV